MIDNYDDLNRDETLDAVAGFGGEKLKQFIAFEREHKDRKTVYKPLERQLIEVTPTQGMYAAGICFEHLNDRQTARQSKRVEQAIEKGYLKVV